MRRFSLWATLAGLALLSATESAPDPPLCRVTAEYRPLWRGSDVGQLAVRLAPGCPPDGVARVRLGNYGWWGSRATGPTEPLNHARPVLIWAGQPRHRSVLWLAKSGKPYAVPIREVTR